MVNIPIFYEGQDDLIELLLVSMTSVLYNTESFIEFYILDCGISLINKKIILTSLNNNFFKKFTIEYIPINMKQFEGLMGYGGFVDCYARLLIPELKKDIKKSIYLDTDTILLQDVLLIYEHNIDNYPYGAALDLPYFVVNQPLKDRAENVAKVPPNVRFPSAGVILVNCEYWRKNNLTKKLLILAEEKKQCLLIIIEELLALYFGDNYFLLDCRYNMTDLRITKFIFPKGITLNYENELKNIVVFHMCGTNKVWKRAYNDQVERIYYIRFFSVFWFYAKMTPYYEGLAIKLMNPLPVRKVNNPVSTVKYYKLFKFIPFLKIESSIHGGLLYKLFNTFPILELR
jgi:lipopolysaccharide biosynthesis glycosyltransferase